MKYVGENALKKWTSLVNSDIKKKLDKNQGTANSGKILGVDVSGEVAPTDTEVATLVDVPNGIIKGDGSTLSTAVAGTDYVAPDGDGSNVTAVFTAVSARTNIATGEKLSVLFGKIAKWFADLGSLAFKSTVAKSDLASDVQTSLGKADSALQNYTETDPTVPAWAKSKTKPAYTASEVGAVPTSRTVNGKALSANITLAASDVGALPSNTHIPSTVAEMSDAGNYALKSDKVSKSGDTMTGKLTVPQVETGDGNSNFFQCRKFRGEGDANTYYHAIDFGYKNHDQVDFHEYGGKWNFYKNQSGKVNEGVLCGSITSNGWEGRAKLGSGSTMVTSQLTENSNVIATTAFVHGLVDGLKPKGVSVTLPASGWNSSSKTQAVTVRGVLADETKQLITPTPAIAFQTAYYNAGIRCTGQSANSLTFTAKTIPTADLTVYVTIQEVRA